MEESEIETTLGIVYKTWTSINCPICGWSGRALDAHANAYHKLKIWQLRLLLGTKDSDPLCCIETEMRRKESREEVAAERRIA